MQHKSYIDLSSECSGAPQLPPSPMGHNCGAEHLRLPAILIRGGGVRESTPNLSAMLHYSRGQ